MHDGVAIRGHEAFVRATVEALELLKAKTPDVYALVQKHIGDIVSGKPSGVFTSMLGFGPTVVVMGPLFSEGSVIEYAGALAHETYHCELYRAAEKDGARNAVSEDAYSGEHAESLCLRYQCDALRRLGLNELHIERYETGLATRWWDVPLDRRDW